MAKYININSKFNPYSFDEMVKPFQMYGEEYKNVENQLSDLNARSSIWENKLDPIVDEQIYTRYKDYSNNHHSNKLLS